METFFALLVFLLPVLVIWLGLNVLEKWIDKKD
jgi:hypothetical protein